MKYTKLFPKTSKQNPADEQSANAILLEKGGFIKKHMAGVYNFLPLGLRVLNKINQIIREEMDAIGGQELLMSALQPKELWEKTGRWESLGEEVMYQFSTKSGDKVDAGLAITHEEVATEIAAKSIHSYKDLPLDIYQIQWKFRNEARPRFGLIRGREFLMKDLYSFDISDEAHQEFYKKCLQAYLNSYKRIGLSAVVVEASGGVFTKEYSHEFQVLVDSGEDEVIHCVTCDFAQNREICNLKKRDKCPRCGSEVLVSKAIEVGNIFHLGTRFSDALGLKVVDEKGSEKPVIMGSYGWGPTRVMGVVVEVYHDDKGIIWPESVAPFQVHLVALDLDDKAVARKAEDIYKLLQVGDPERSRRVENIEVLFDDRIDVSAGEKFADADLIGIPYRVVVSKKTGDKLEIKKRSEKETRFLEFPEFLKMLK